MLVMMELNSVSNSDLIEQKLFDLIELCISSSNTVRSIRMISEMCYM